MRVKPVAMPTAETLVFYGLAALVLGGGAGVALSRNLMRSAFMLLATLAGTAGLYLFLGADFVGVTQLLVYVGGILVLLLFAVLLTARIGRARDSNAGVGRGPALALAGLVAALTIGVVVVTPWPRTEAIATPTTARLGDAFLREALLPFELVSLLLLMALVGAMVIARRALRASVRDDTGETPRAAGPAQPQPGAGTP
jgi:NAD(P)H-quinone oxidoreductase subunit 6